MLTIKQLKLAGPAITDKALCKFPVDIRCNEKSWSDGTILFYEPCPKVAYEPHPLTEGHEVLINRMLAEIRGYDDLKAIRFTNGEQGTWFDGKLVNALVKRAGKAPVTFMYNDYFKSLTVHNGKPLGMVMALRESRLTEDCDWNFAYTGDLPA
jgi:hypothetical protein